MATKTTRYTFEAPPQSEMKQLAAVFNRSTTDELSRATGLFKDILKTHRTEYHAPVRHSVDFISGQSSGKNKSIYVTFLSICLGTERNFMFFYDRMDAPEKKLLMTMCLSNRMEVYSALKIAPDLFQVLTGRYMYEPKACYRGLFDFLKNLEDRRWWSSFSYFTLPHELAERIWRYVMCSRPVEINVTVALPDNAGRRLDFSDEVAKNLEAVLWAVKSDGIKTTKDGIATVAALKRLQKTTGIAEFCDDPKKGFPAQRTTDLVLPMMRYFRSTDIKDGVTPLLVKMIWSSKELFGGRTSTRLMTLPLYGKGATQEDAAYVLANYLKPIVGKEVFETRQTEWISIEDVFRYAVHRPEYQTRCDNYLPKMASIDIDGSGKTVPLAGVHEDMTWDVLCGLCSWMCAWGLVECAFDKEAYEGSLAGMRWLRLTGLGRYALGFTSSYEFPASQSDRKEWFADPERTILVAEVEKPMSLPVIARFGKKITDRRYLIDAATIMTACNDDEEISNAIKILKTIIGDPMPEIWTRLFADLDRRKSISVDEPEPYMLVKLPPDDMGLMRLCMSDPVISTVAMRCEGAKLLVKQGDYPKLLKAFRALGYMPDMTYSDWQHLPRTYYY